MAVCLILILGENELAVMMVLHTTRWPWAREVTRVETCTGPHYSRLPPLPCTWPDSSDKLWLLLGRYGPLWGRVSTRWQAWRHLPPSRQFSGTTRSLWELSYQRVQLHTYLCDLQDDFIFSVSFRRYGRSLHARIEQWNHMFSFDAHESAAFKSKSVKGQIGKAAPPPYSQSQTCWWLSILQSITRIRTLACSLSQCWPGHWTGQRHSVSNTWPGRALL